MANTDIITIPLRLPRDEAVALAQLVKRLNYNTANTLRAKFRLDPIWTQTHFQSLSTPLDKTAIASAADVSALRVHLA